MTAIPPSEEYTFVKNCVLVLGLVIALLSILFFLTIVVSCDSPFMREIIRKDYIEVKHIAADDLKDVSKEIDKEYQESKQEEVQTKEH